MTMFLLLPNSNWVSLFNHPVRYGHWCERTLLEDWASGQAVKLYAPLPVPCRSRRNTFVRVHDFCDGLGWEFQFLVPISGTPIGSGIPILFPIPDIPVRFFFWILLLKIHQIGIPIPKFDFPNFGLHRNSIHLILNQKTIAISFPAKITSTCSTCKTSRCHFGGQHIHAAKSTSTQNE